MTEAMSNQGQGKRVADYRLICSIQDRCLVVLLLKVGRRRDIYD
jgi:mRNA-degrading endonuclease RelE of RelBE toxin-antitoxin system